MAGSPGSSYPGRQRRAFRVDGAPHTRDLFLYCYHPPTPCFDSSPAHPPKSSSCPPLSRPSDPRSSLSLHDRGLGTVSSLWVSLSDPGTSRLRGVGCPPRRSRVRNKMDPEVWRSCEPTLVLRPEGGRSLLVGLIGSCTSSPVGPPWTTTVSFPPRELPGVRGGPGRRRPRPPVSGLEVDLRVRPSFVHAEMRGVPVAESFGGRRPPVPSDTPWVSVPRRVGKSDSGPSRVEYVWYRDLTVQV